MSFDLLKKGNEMPGVRSRRSLCQLILLFTVGAISIYYFTKSPTSTDPASPRVRNTKDEDEIINFVQDIQGIKALLPLTNESWHMKTDRDLADKLSKEIRILCWIAVTDKSLERAKLINETWGRRCSKILFMGDESTKGIDGVISLDIRKGRNQLWPKTREAFRYIARHHMNDAEWFYKADTDTYAIMENLRYLLSMQDPSKPHYLGCNIRLFVPNGYMSGGAGYVLNQLSLYKLVTKGFDVKKCYNGYQEDEDVSLGYCMGKINILPEDVTDEKQKNRFFPFEPYDHVGDSKIGNNKWYWNSSLKPGKKSLDCCSETVVSFHYVPVNVFWTMEYLLYHTHLFGVTHSLELTTDRH